jgi:SanA protein
MRWLVRVFLYVLGGVLLVLLVTNLQIVLSTKNNLYAPGEQPETYPIAIILGTSNKTADGEPNQFFENRIETAATLYKEGKITHIIVSGDNRSKYYNEPRLMQKALLDRGVPSDVITLDYAGLRTLDSIVRGKEIFGQGKLTIITQTFHGYRALFISQYYGVDAMVVAAPDPDDRLFIMVKLREYFARTKAWLDLYILKTSPQHLGEKEQLNNQPLKDND